MLDLSPQIFEVMGASRRLTRFTSMCLLPVTLEFSKTFNSEVTFLMSSRSIPTVFGFFSFGFPAACCSVPGTGHTPGRGVSVLRQRPFLHALGAGLAGCSRRFAVVARQEGHLPRARETASVRPGRMCLVVMSPHGATPPSTSPPHKSCVSGTKSHDWVFSLKIIRSVLCGRTAFVDLLCFYVTT